jgi:hypothetical protein
VARLHAYATLAAERAAAARDIVEPEHARIDRAKTSFQKSACRSSVDQHRLLIMTGDGETIVC